MTGRTVRSRLRWVAAALTVLAVVAPAWSASAAPVALARPMPGWDGG